MEGLEKIRAMPFEIRNVNEDRAPEKLGETWKGIIYVCQYCLSPSGGFGLVN